MHRSRELALAVTVPRVYFREEENGVTVNVKGQQLWKSSRTPWRARRRGPRVDTYGLAAPRPGSRDVDTSCRGCGQGSEVLPDAVESETTRAMRRHRLAAPRPGSRAVDTSCRGCGASVGWIGWAERTGWMCWGCRGQESTMSRSLLEYAVAYQLRQR
ncbi:hypothetical protein BC629DRAFT_919992 [Irpex lacteus]|nr:hypothetical protein BC629DRAFT_919992 [Irpex lacteus]